MVNGVRSLLVCLCVVVAGPVWAQGSPAETLSAIDASILRADAALEEARALSAELREALKLTPPATMAIVVPCQEDERARAEAFQRALDAVTALGRIELEPGCVYTSFGFANKTTPFQFKGNKGGRVVLTTRGFVRSTAIGHAGRITPVAAPALASIRAGTGNVSSGLEVWNGPDGGRLDIEGVQFLHNLPNGHGEMLKIGHDKETNPENLAAGIRIRQVIFQGDELVGQKRAIAAMGRDILIEQIWCEDIFIAGQDTQCVAAWNGGKQVTIRLSYLQAGAENILVGGAPMAGASAAMSPEGWLIEDNILHKPLRWKADGRNRQVKNLLEFKFGRGLVARRNLLVNNWSAAQAGIAVLINYTTNGRCPACPGLHDVVFEENVVLNSPGGIANQGHAYAANTFSAERLQRLTVRQNYFVLTGTRSARTVMISNVRGPHDVRYERNTFINGTMTNWLTGSFGTVWVPGPEGVAVRQPGGPMQGLVLVGNVFTHSGTYGATMPDGAHGGSGIATFATGGLQVAGNIFGDGGSAATRNLMNVNALLAGGPLNRLQPKAALLKALPVTACGEVEPGTGASCTRLAPVFDLQKYLPEP